MSQNYAPMCSIGIEISKSTKPLIILLIWLNEKGEIEIARDWSSKSLNVTEIERYYESLMSELEKREIQVSAVQDRGEALMLQHYIPLPNVSRPT